MKFTYEDKLKNVEDYEKLVLPNFCGNALIQYNNIHQSIFYVSSLVPLNALHILKKK